VSSYRLLGAVGFKEVCSFVNAFAVVEVDESQKLDLGSSISRDIRGVD
jgi:hypothetical protein